MLPTRPTRCRRRGRSTSSTCSVGRTHAVAHAREAVAVGARRLWLEQGIADEEAGRIAHAGRAVGRDGRCTASSARRLVTGWPAPARAGPRPPPRASTRHTDRPQHAGRVRRRRRRSSMPQIDLDANPATTRPWCRLPVTRNRATRIAELFDGGVAASRLVTSHRGLLGTRARSTAPRSCADDDDGHADDVDRHGGAAQSRGHDVHPALGRWRVPGSAASATRSSR